MGKQNRRSKKVHAAQLQLIGHIGQHCRECGKQFNTLDDLKYAIINGEGVVCRDCVGESSDALQHRDGFSVS